MVIVTVKFEIRGSRIQGGLKICSSPKPASMVFVFALGHRLSRSFALNKNLDIAMHSISRRNRPVIRFYAKLDQFKKF